MCDTCWCDDCLGRNCTCSCGRAIYPSDSNVVYRFDYFRGRDTRPSILDILGNGKIVFNNSPPHGSAHFIDGSLHLSFHCRGIVRLVKSHVFVPTGKHGVYICHSADPEWCVRLEESREYMSGASAIYYDGKGSAYLQEVFLQRTDLRKGAYSSCVPLFRDVKGKGKGKGFSSYPYIDKALPRWLPFRCPQTNRTWHWHEETGMSVFDDESGE